MAADGPTSSYSLNAQQAASASTTCEPGGCPSCVKAGLPVLLVRPGIAERAYAQSKQAGLRPLLDMHTAPVVLHDAGYVARTLRWGFVMAWYETPHTPQLKAQKGWQAFMVNDGGYMTPWPLNGLAAAFVEPFSCERTAAYAAAMLFVIPDAKHTGRVWVGYSDHPWNENVRDAYAGDEKLRDQRMACINAPTATCRRSLPLTSRNVRKYIADYDPKASLADFKGLPFEPLARSKEPGIPDTRPESHKDLLEQADVILKSGRAHGFTLKDAMIVSVPDAIGITTETGERRYALCNTAANWLQNEPEGAWRLNTALSIEGLLTLTKEKGDKDTERIQGFVDKAGLAVNREQFDAMKADGRLPREAEFEENWIKPSSNPNTWYPDARNGQVRLPGRREMAARTRSLTQRVLDKLGSDDNYPFRTFLQTYQDKAAADQKRLATVEVDYGGWLTSPARKLVTVHDFDSTDPLDGAYYARAVAMITLHGHLSETGLEWYKPFLREDPNEKDNLLVRAMLGNQTEFFAWFSDPKQQTKLHKELKNLFKLFEEPVSGVKPGPVAAARLAAAKNLLAMGFDHSLILTLGATASALNVRNALPESLNAKLTMLMEAVVQATAATAAKASTAAAPMLVKLKMPLAQAARFWRIQTNAVEAFSKRTVGKDVRSLAVGGAMALDLAGAPGAAGGLVEVYAFSRKTSAALSSAAEQSAAALNAMVRSADGLRTVAIDTAAILRAGSASLSAAGGVLQMLSLAKTLKLYEHGSAEERQKAAFSILGAGLGLAGASMEISEAIAKQRQKTVVARGLKVAAGRASAIGLAIDAVVAAGIAKKEIGKGDGDAATAYLAQSVSFGGAAVAGWVYAYGIATTGASTTVFLGLSMTGWGLVLIGLGLAAGYIAHLLDDTPTEEWAARCIWGDADEKWGSEPNEQSQLNKVLIGVRLDFSYRSSFNLYNFGRHTTNDAMGMIAPDAAPMTREVWARLVLPTSIRESAAWTLQVHGTDRNGIHNELVWIDKATQRKPEVDGGVVAASIDDQGEIIEISVRLDMFVFRRASAHLQIYDRIPDGSLLVDESLQ